MTLPNFVIIGASKSGATALAWYLDEHPDISMGRRHHANYLAYAEDEDGEVVYGDPELHRWHIKTLEAYEDVFADVGDVRAIGDASTIYMETPHAPARIRELIPGARIICGLRQPADRAYSDYLSHLRKRGLRLDEERDLRASADWAQPDSHWMVLGRYHEHLSRYFDLFPREQIYVFLSEDLRADTKSVVQDIYSFLGVDPDFVPDLETPHNVGGVPSNLLLDRLLSSHRLRTAVKPFVPRGLANRLRRLRTSNMQRPPLPADLRRQLTDQLEDEIRKTGDLIGIDLDHWLN